MGPREFGRLAAAELMALHEAWRARERRADYRAAVLVTVYANAHRDEKEQPVPFQLGDFFPSLVVDEDEPEAEPTEAEIAMLTAALGAVNR